MFRSAAAGIIGAPADDLRRRRLCVETRIVDDPIAAVASARGAGLVHVVRASGAGCIDMARPLIEGGLPTGGFRAADVSVRLRIAGRDVRVPARMLLFRAPLSYTRQEAFELHVGGGPLAAQVLFEALLRRGFRRAGPGEFTRRACLSGRISLAQARAVDALIRARGEREAAAAVSALLGTRRPKMSALRRHLLALRSLIEAEMDFYDQDPPVFSRRRFLRSLRALVRRVMRIVVPGVPSALPRVVLAGPSNAGKSSLFNALLGRARAVVHTEAGTTRDAVEAECELAGERLILVDTAGLFSAASADVPGAASAAAAADALAGAFLVLWVVGADQQPLPPRLPAGRPSSPAALLRVMNKCDLRRPTWAEEGRWLAVSAATGEGLAELREALLGRLRTGGWGAATASEDERGAALEAARALAAAAALLRRDAPTELAAEELRHADNAMARLLGGDLTEDLLDAVFGRFCVGK